MRYVDIVIVGHGIAGATLAWELEKQGAEFVVIDPAERDTTSQVAAGLMTPVTGMRLVKSWRFEELSEAAWRFYREVEAVTGCSVLFDGPMIRYLNSPAESEYLNKRRADPNYTSLFAESDQLPQDILNPWGAVMLLQGGQLDVAMFLDSMRARLQTQQRAITSRLDWQSVRAGSDGVELSDLNIRTQCLVMADGAAARWNPFFPANQFNATRGEILTVAIPNWDESRIIHGPVWIAPVRSGTYQGCYRVGATYDWTNLDVGPTPEGRNELEGRLRNFLRSPWNTVDHKAAVRPILKSPYPLVERSPVHPHIYFWNGLGSKGSLQAPWFARQLAQQLVSELNEK